MNYPWITISMHDTKTHRGMGEVDKSTFLYQRQCFTGFRDISVGILLVDPGSTQESPVALKTQFPSTSTRHAGGGGGASGPMADDMRTLFLRKEVPGSVAFLRCLVVAQSSQGWPLAS